MGIFDKMKKGKKTDTATEVDPNAEANAEANAELAEAATAEADEPKVEAKPKVAKKKAPAKKKAAKPATTIVHKLDTSRVPGPYKALYVKDGERHVEGPSDDAAALRARLEGQAGVSRVNVVQA